MEERSTIYRFIEEVLESHRGYEIDTDDAAVMLLIRFHEENEGNFGFCLN